MRNAIRNKLFVTFVEFNFELFSDNVIQFPKHSKLFKVHLRNAFNLKFIKITKKLHSEKPIIVCALVTRQKTKSVETLLTISISWLNEFIYVSTEVQKIFSPLKFDKQFKWVQNEVRCFKNFIAFISNSFKNML